MPALPDPPILTTNGVYEVPVEVGREYLLTLKGAWDGASIELFFYSAALSDYTPVDGGSWTANAEIRLVAPSPLAALVVGNDGASTEVGVTFIPILK